jgi:hypothetical protein
MDARWNEVKKLCQWASQKISRVKKLPGVKGAIKK